MLPALEGVCHLREEGGVSQGACAQPAWRVGTAASSSLPQPPSHRAWVWVRGGSSSVDASPCSWEHHPAPRNSLPATWRSRPSQLAKGRTKEGAGDRQSWGQNRRQLRTWQSKCDNVPKQLSLQPRPTCFQTAFCVTPTQPRAGSPSLGTKANTIDGRNDWPWGKTAGFFAV